MTSAVPRPVDWQERRMARDPQHSWIVQAPAGSGKTELLTQRMLGLLARSRNPEEVVAITFTRKAAAEMSRRLVKRLQAATSEPEGPLEPHQLTSRRLALEVLENDRKRGWNLMEQPGRLRIRTIDSLCNELARQLPILSGLGGSPQVAKDPEPLYRLAAARTMAAIEDDRDDLQADVIRVLDRYDNQYDRLVDLLTGMLAHREQWISHLWSIRTTHGFDRHSLEQALQVLIEAELRSALALLPPALLTELPRYLSFARRHLEGDAGRSIDQLLDGAGGADNAPLHLDARSESLPLWLTLARFLLTRQGEWRRSIDKNLGFPALGGSTGEERALRKRMKAGLVELLDSVRDNEELLDRLRVVRKLPRPDYDDESWQSLESLMRILIRGFQEWKLVMSETGQTDFSEIAARALQALGGEDQPSNLAMRLDYRIEHLLVDEFQDTSLTQIRLLRRLTAGWAPGDGRTLFLVGDPMQSIYRFRKAEVSLFIEAFEGRLFRDIDLKPLQLSVNFRSTRPLIKWVNQVFPEVMPAVSDPLKDAVHFSPSDPRPDAGDAGQVEIAILPQQDEDEEARRVLEIIANTPAEESIAILVRSRRHAAPILARLDRLKEDSSRYRYQAIEFNPLAETPAIRDLAALTLALTQVADRLAWLSVLRSPFVGLDLADLDALTSPDPSRIVADVLRNIEASGPGGHAALSRDGAKRLQRVTPVLLQAIENQGRVTSRSLVEDTWLRLGGPACLQNDAERIDAATYFDLLDTLEDEGLAVDRDTLGLSMENLFAQPDALASGRLQVMTLFAAKGLQFGTVIVPGMNRTTGTDRSKLLNWFEMAGEDRIVMSPMLNAREKERQSSEGGLVQFIADVENRRQRLENGRLLYVAATRAVHDLHLIGGINPDKNGEFHPRNGTLLAELWPAVNAEQQDRLQLAMDERHTVNAESAEMEAAAAGPHPGSASSPRFIQAWRRLPADWRLPAPPGAVACPVNPPFDVHDAIEFRWAGEDARLAGNMVHRLLQLVAEQGIEQWHAKGGMDRYGPWCRRQLASEGVTARKADKVIQRTAAAITRCLSSERGRWVVGPHEEALCEYALTAVLDGQPQRLVLDRSFVDRGERWIIDYKTSSHSGGDLQAFLASEADRYASQLQRYREAMALGESRPIRTALYFPLLDQFVEL